MPSHILVRRFGSRHRRLVSLPNQLSRSRGT
jgi:hypothetical protein